VHAMFFCALVVVFIFNMHEKKRSKRKFRMFISQMRGKLAKKKTQKASEKRKMLSLRFWAGVRGRGESRRSPSLQISIWLKLVDTHCSNCSALSYFFFLSIYAPCVTLHVCAAKIFMQMHLKHFKSVSAVQFA